MVAKREGNTTLPYSSEPNSLRDKKQEMKRRGAWRGVGRSRDSASHTDRPRRSGIEISEKREAAEEAGKGLASAARYGRGLISTLIFNSQPDSLASQEAYGSTAR